MMKEKPAQAIPEPEPTTHHQIAEDELLRLEQQFIDKYYTGDNKKPLRTLIRMYKGYYRKLLLSSVCFCVKMLCFIVTPLLTADIMDTLTQNREAFLPVLTRDMLLLLFLLALNIPFHVLYTKLSSQASRAVEAGLRGAVVKKLQKLTIRFDTAMQSGRIQSKIIRDVENIHGMFGQLFNSIMDVGLNMLCMIAVLIIRGDWLIFLFYALCVPMAILISRLFLKNFRKKSRDFRHEMEHTSSRVVDMVEMIPITRAHALADVEVNKMNRQVGDLAGRGMALDVYGALFHSVNWSTIQLFSLFCLAFCGFLAYKGTFTVGDVTLYTSYFNRFVGYVSTILGLIPVIASGTEAITSVGEILAAEDIEQNEGKVAADTLHGTYDFRGVTFRYEESTPILRGLDLHVEAGETIALVGESGAGKTTVLNLITGFYLPDGGTLTIDGREITDIDLESYRRHIAMVPQTSVLFSGTVRDNIVYGLEREVSEEELNKVLADACLTDVVAKLPQGIDTPVGERGNTLSGGQRQRMAIARALIRDPSVIIFDEATSALDTVSEKKIQQAIANMTRGRTTFIVAHRLSTIRDADKIAVMEEGRCVEYGTYDELMEKKGAFYRFKSLQV